MMRAVILAAAVLASAAPAQDMAEIPVPTAITADGVPALPDSLRAATQPYLAVRPAAHAGG